MKRIPVKAPTRRYYRTCAQLKYFLLDQLKRAEWLPSQKSEWLIEKVKNISIRHGALETLWQVTCHIYYTMMEYDVDPEKLIPFTRTALSIRSRGDENV